MLFLQMTTNDLSETENNVWCVPEQYIVYCLYNVRGKEEIKKLQLIMYHS